MIAGERIVLTELRSEDIATMSAWINDPETVRMNAPFLPVHSVNHAAWFDVVAKDPSKVIFAIRKRNDSAIAGVVQLIDIHQIHRSAELTIRIGTECDRNQGFGTEAVQLMLRFAFNDLNLHRVWLRVFSTNERATKVYEKVGMTLEGVMKEAAWIDGQWVDTRIFGLIRNYEETECNSKNVRTI